MVTLSTRLVRALAASLLLLVLGGAAVAVAAPGDIGHREGRIRRRPGRHRDRSPRARSGSTTDQWWASEWSNSPAGFYIDRLDTSTETFVRTGTLIEAEAQRTGHPLGRDAPVRRFQNFSESGSLTGGVTRIYRFSYNTNTDTYTLDNGFPATMRGTVRSRRS